MIGEVFVFDGSEMSLQFNDGVKYFYSGYKKGEMKCVVVCEWNMKLVYVMANYCGDTHDNDV